MKKSSVCSLVNISSFFVYILFSSSSNASCDCGSVDINQPCTGVSISTVVAATSVNGDQSRDARFEWRFNSGGNDAYCGQFANGDYWIAPKSGADIQITQLSGNSDVSLDINPQLRSMSLLDGSNNYGNYSVERSSASALPVSFNSAVSLVAAAKRDEQVSGDCGTKSIVGECVDAYQIVTVLETLPEKLGSYSLRPNITRANKVVLSLDEFDFESFPSLSLLNGTNGSGLEAIRQRWSHSTEIFGLVYAPNKAFSEGGRAFRSHILIDDYAAGVARQWADDLMVLFSSDHSLTDKQPALSAMLTYGQDIITAIYNESGNQLSYWGSGAGQHMGRFPPAALFAALKVNSDYRDLLQKVALNMSDIDGTGPHELDQVNLGVNTPVWGDYAMGERGYWSNLFDSQCYEGAAGTCNPLLGKKTIKDPYGFIDGPANKPGTSYLEVTIGPMRSMVASLSLFPKMCRVVNYSPLTEYVDRVHSVGVWTKDDDCAPPDPREDIEGCDVYRNTGCIYYGVTWGPDPQQSGQCIKNQIGQNGRFPSLHGTAVRYYYTSEQVELNWEEIRRLDSCSDSRKPNPPANLEVR